MFVLMLLCLAGCASVAPSEETPPNTPEKEAYGVPCEGFQPSANPDYVYVVPAGDVCYAVNADGKLLLTTYESCEVLYDEISGEQKYICLSRGFASDVNVTGLLYDFSFQLYSLDGNLLCDWQSGRLQYVWDDKGAVTRYEGLTLWGMNYSIVTLPDMQTIATYAGEPDFSGELIASISAEWPDEGQSTALHTLYVANRDGLPAFTKTFKCDRSTAISYLRGGKVDGVSYITINGPDNDMLSFDENGTLVETLSNEYHPVSIYNTVFGTVEEFADRKIMSGDGLWLTDLDGNKLHDFGFRELSAVGTSRDPEYYIAQFPYDVPSSGGYVLLDKNGRFLIGSADIYCADAQENLLLLIQVVGDGENNDNSNLLWNAKTGAELTLGTNEYASCYSDPKTGVSAALAYSVFAGPRNALPIKSLIDGDGQPRITGIGQIFSLSEDRLCATRGFRTGLMDRDGNWVIWWPCLYSNEEYPDPIYD